MKSRSYILALLSFVFYFGHESLIAQTNFPNELKIGDKFPDIQFRNVLNYRSKTAKLSDFKGKLVILDLWGVFCSSCIHAFPEMQKLQDQFKDKLQILLVNPDVTKYDTEEKTKSILETFTRRTGIKLTMPVPLNDSIINYYFPHEGVPHEVWIGSNGKVIAITGSDEVNFKNISVALTEKEINLPVKNDYGFDIETPLLVNGNGGNDEDFLYRSMFTNYNRLVNSYSGGTHWNKKRETTGWYMLNIPLSSIINYAYSEVINDNTSLNRMVYEVKDPIQFNRNGDTSNQYCYDVTFPAEKNKKIDVKSYLKEDLKRVFNVRVYQEKRKMKSLVISSNEKINKLFSKSKPEADVAPDSKSIKKFIHGMPVAKAFKFLEVYSKYPSVDETGIKVNIDLDFPDNFNFYDTVALYEFLSSVGFDIKVQERYVDVIVITDKPDIENRVIQNGFNSVQLKSQLQSIKKQKNDVTLNYILQNPQSEYSPVEISNLVGQGDMSAQLGNVLNEKLDGEVKNHLWSAVIRSQLRKILIISDSNLAIHNTSLPEEFKVNCFIEGLKRGDTLYLLHRKFPYTSYDTTVLLPVGEQFSFKVGKSVGPSFYHIKRNEGPEENDLLMFLDNSDIRVDGNINDLVHCVVKGSKSQKDMEEFKKITDPYDVESKRLSTEITKANSLRLVY